MAAAFVTSSPKAPLKLAIVLETSLNFAIHREVGMSMDRAATPFMEAKGNARIQDKNGIITGSIL